MNLNLPKFLALALLPLLAACGSFGNNRPAPAPVPVVQAPVIHVKPRPAADPSQRDQSLYYTPKTMEGRAVIRVALLLPFNSPKPETRALAASLYNSAQLALFEFNNPNILLMPKATGSAIAARQAASEAISEGADMILGPVFAEEVRAITPVARAAHVPVVAFSSDSTVAGEGVYLLSFPPEAEISRIVDFAVLNGITKFASLTPQDDYGARVGAAFAKSVADHGSKLTDSATYPTTSIEAMNVPVQRVAHYSGRHADLVTKKSQLAAAGDTAGLAALGNVDAIGDLPFQAILISDGGERLRAVAPLLPYYEVDPRKVKFLGTGLWDDKSLWSEPALDGGWYTAPPPEAHEQFVQRYTNIYHAAPPRIASLAYDGVSLAVALSQQPAETRFTAATLTHTDGFAGVDGIFRFLPDGHTERGLAVLEIHPSGAVIIDPAPVSFGVPAAPPAY
ncbi:MAG: penicillin-binding protein activator [Parvibaculaceae bacterium]